MTFITDQIGRLRRSFGIKTTEPQSGPEPAASSPGPADQSSNGVRPAETPAPPATTGP